MWPTGMKELGIDAVGQDRRAALAEPGRALGRLTDIGWGAALRALLSEQTPDGPVTDQLADAMVQVLASWDWKQRPAAVVAMPSRTRPTLITSLGQRIAAIGRLPYLGTLGYATEDGPGPRRHNSAQRLAALWRALVVPDDLRDALSAHRDGPGAAGRRPDRHRLDDDRGRDAAARRGRPGRASAGAGRHHRLRLPRLHEASRSPSPVASRPR